MQMRIRSTLFAVLALLTCAAAANAASAKSTAVFRMAIESDQSGTAVGSTINLTIRLHSLAAWPVQGITVSMTQCEQFNSVPFQLARRTRHMKPSAEKLVSYARGFVLEWTSMPSASTSSTRSLQLHLKVPDPRKGGGYGDPVYCFQAQAWVVGTSIISPLERVYWGNTK